MPSLADHGAHRLGAASRRTAIRLAIVGNVIPIAVATAVDFESHRAVFFAGAVLACVAPVAVTALSRSRPVAFHLAAYGGIVGLTALQAYGGGAASGYSVLLMMPMVWFGLQATDREQLVACGLLVLCAFAPMLVLGAPAYPVRWGNATLLVLVGVTVAGSLRFSVREAQRLNRRLARQAIADELTGLLNRRGWRQETVRVLARAAREEAPVSLLLLDLDGLKETNDSLGHDEGDRRLAGTAARLGEALREGDVPARLGGDEFAALLPGATLADAVAVAERLRARTPTSAGYSSAIATWDGRETMEELMRRGDVALYVVKASGGGSDEIAPEPMAIGDLHAPPSRG